MGDLDLHFQGHLAVQGLKLTRFSSCKAVTRKVFGKTGPNLDRICKLQSFKSDSIMGNLDIHFQGHLTVQGFNLTQFGCFNAITQNPFCET